ncbi:hypothetical protein Rfer_0926 [Rhodoferax ferrireducens T118]|uniref:Uncharacterized protein n=1 Tax=Albidiferax ferrireducens (strain ATCC BAA-621 / DSM 15236 / T118) TaxID=338969 RepID=Q21ZY0_ALBFT|nr:hypothetical protein Rfer_0926 [Rhodoferax ferrireducens T118]
MGINLDNAFKAHADWRTKLSAAATRHEQPDAETMSRGNCCEMGKWPLGAGATKSGGRPTFVAIIRSVNLASRQILLIILPCGPR